MAVDQELLFLLKSINTKAVFEQKAPLKMSGYIYQDHKDSN